MKEGRSRSKFISPEGYRLSDNYKSTFQSVRSIDEDYKDKQQMKRSLDQLVDANMKKTRLLEKVVTEYSSLSSERNKQSETFQSASLYEYTEKYNTALDEKKTLENMKDKLKKSVILCKERLDKLNEVYEKFEKYSSQAKQSKNIASNCLSRARNDLASVHKNFIENKDKMEKKNKEKKLYMDKQKITINKLITEINKHEEQILSNTARRETIRALIQEHVHKHNENEKELRQSSLKNIEDAVEALKEITGMSRFDPCGLIDHFQAFQSKEISLSRHFTDLTSEYLQKKNSCDEFKDMLQTLKSNLVHTNTHSVSVNMLKATIEDSRSLNCENVYSIENFIVGVYFTVKNLGNSIIFCFEGIKKYAPVDNTAYKTIEKDETTIKKCLMNFARECRPVSQSNSNASTIMRYFNDSNSVTDSNLKKSHHNYMDKFRALLENFKTVLLVLSEAKSHTELPKISKESLPKLMTSSKSSNIEKYKIIKLNSSSARKEEFPTIANNKALEHNLDDFTSKNVLKEVLSFEKRLSALKCKQINDTDRINKFSRHQLLDSTFRCRSSNAL